MNLITASGLGAREAAKHTLSRCGRGIAACSIALLALGGLTVGPHAQADIGATHTRLVSEFASFNTPGALNGRVETIAVDGDTVFVGGTFTQIQDPLNGDIIDQPYLFAYSKRSGDILRGFDPVLNGDVLALEVPGDGSGVFAGGKFTQLNGRTNRRGLLKLDKNGDRDSVFIPPRPRGSVKTLVRFGNTLYAGGGFSEIGGQPIQRLAALNATTGSVSSALNLQFGGVISRQGGVQGSQSVDDIDVTSDGQVMVAAGNFETVDGNSRQRLVVIELDGQAQVSRWNTNVYDIQCPNQFPQYIRGIDISPDDDYLLVGTTGFRIIGEPACDTTNRYELTDLNNNNVRPTWTNYTGGDTVYDVVSTGHAVYIGGHFRFLDNDFGSGGDPGPGATQRRGMAALDPLNGLTLQNWRSDRNPRGFGTFALIAEDEGLYIGDDTDFLNGSEHQKLKFLPLSSNILSRPNRPTLPTTALTVSGSTLSASSFNGSSFGNIESLTAGLSNVRGAMFVGGQLYYADVNDNVWASRFNGNTFEDRRRVDLGGQTDADWDIDQIGGMFFDYEFGRVYYTYQDDSRLFYRAFTPDTSFFGNDEFVAEVQGDILWNSVRGMDVIDGRLYFARTDGNLYRAAINGAAVVSRTTEQVSGTGIDGRRWENNFLAFLSDGAPTGTPTDPADPTDPPNPTTPGGAELEFESFGTQNNGRFRKFEFPVTAGEETTVLLEWTDPSASVNLFVRDAGNNLVAADRTSAGSPKLVTVPAGNGGTHVAAVLVREGATPYTLKINPAGVAAPTPLADFEFSGTGSDDTGSWQVFRFDVAAGEQVDAQVIWNDPTAQIRAFLRQQGPTVLIDRDTAGTSPATMSGTASASGTWSVAVRIREGSNVDFDVLVNTTP